jgi:hypothetical protein
MENRVQNVFPDDKMQAKLKEGLQKRKSFNKRILRKIRNKKLDKQ